MDLGEHLAVLEQQQQQQQQNAETKEALTRWAHKGRDCVRGGDAA